MKVLLLWGSKSAELQFVDVKPTVLLFSGHIEAALAIDPPNLSISIKVGHKWHDWEELECKWDNSSAEGLLGLVPQWEREEQREFKKYLELMLSI
jgi:hypothetical protein